MISRYLYSKICESHSRFATLLLLDEYDKIFLKKHNIYFYTDGHYYYIDADQIKKLFCNH